MPGEAAGIVLAAAFFEPDWRSGKAVATRIRRADGPPMVLAGLWSSWKAPACDLVQGNPDAKQALLSVLRVHTTLFRGLES